MSNLRIVLLALLGALGFSSACADAEAVPLERPAVATEIPGFERPQATGRLPAALREASGIVQSAWDDDRFWVHNDSGYAPELFAISLDGTLRAKWTLPVRNRDWEDIARGPCHRGDRRRSCLYVGEIGDNNARYESIAIHRVHEPEHLEASTRTLQPSEVETMHLVYPDGRYDAESLVVDDDLQVWILTKRPAGVTRLYTAPFAPNEEPVPLTFIRAFDLRELAVRGARDFPTAADWDPDRRIFLLRLYTLAAAFLVPSGDLRTLFDTPGTLVPTGVEIQGEAIAWTRAGGYVHVSEGSEAVIWHVRRREGVEDHTENPAATP